MKLTIKQKAISIFGEYTVSDEKGNDVYTVKGKPAVTKTFEIYDAKGHECGKIKEKLVSLVPHWVLYIGDECIGDIAKNITLIKDKFTIGYDDWVASGDILDFNYDVTKGRRKVFSIKRRALRVVTPVYTLEIERKEDILPAVMVAIAIFAIKSDEKDNDK